MKSPLIEVCKNESFPGKSRFVLKEGWLYEIFTKVKLGGKIFGCVVKPGMLCVIRRVGKYYKAYIPIFFTSMQDSVAEKIIGANEEQILKNIGKIEDGETIVISLETLSPLRTEQFSDNIRFDGKDKTILLLFDRKGDESLSSSKVEEVILFKTGFKAPLFDVSFLNAIFSLSSSVFSYEQDGEQSVFNIIFFTLLSGIFSGIDPQNLFKETGSIGTNEAELWRTRFVGKHVNWDDEGKKLLEKVNERRLIECLEIETPANNNITEGMPLSYIIDNGLDYILRTTPKTERVQVEIDFPCNIEYMYLEGGACFIRPKFAIAYNVFEEMLESRNIVLIS